MNKIYLYVGLALIGLFLYFQFIGLVEDNAKLEIENADWKEAARLLGEDSERKSEINIKRSKKLSEIRKANKVLQHDLSKLITTPQQAKCDVTPLPAGYIDRVLSKNNRKNKKDTP